MCAFRQKAKQHWHLSSQDSVKIRRQDHWGRGEGPALLCLCAAANAATTAATAVIAATAALLLYECVFN